jgi:hypothetical protein
MSSEQPPYTCVLCGDSHGDDRGAAIACCARFGFTPPEVVDDE